MKFISKLYQQVVRSIQVKINAQRGRRNLRAMREAMPKRVRSLNQ